MKFGLNSNKVKSASKLQPSQPAVSILSSEQSPTDFVAANIPRSEAGVRQGGGLTPGRALHFPASPGLPLSSADLRSNAAGGIGTGIGAGLGGATGGAAAWTDVASEQPWTRGIGASTSSLFAQDRDLGASNGGGPAGVGIGLASSGRLASLMNSRGSLAAPAAAAAGAAEGSMREREREGLLAVGKALVDGPAELPGSSGASSRALRSRPVARPPSRPVGPVFVDESGKTVSILRAAPSRKPCCDGLRSFVNFLFG